MSEYDNKCGGSDPLQHRLHDVLKAVAIPVIEVHMSNILKRNGSATRIVDTPVALGGFTVGFLSYRLAMMAAADLLNIPG